MDRVRLMCWCPSSVSAVHLPAFAAAEAGLFAEQDLDVVFVEWIYGATWNLRAFGSYLGALAEDRADFALTAVAYLLAGVAETEQHLGARFAAILHQRHPIAGIVAEESGLNDPADLPGRRTAWNGSWFAEGYWQALAHMGLAPPEAVAPVEDPHAALARGEVDVIPAWVNAAARPSEGGGAVRAVPLDIDVYASGLAAADRLSPELVSRTRDALLDGCRLQRAQPEVGIAAFRRWFGYVSEEHLRTAWSLFEPYAFDEPAACSMDATRWQTTIEYTAAAHGLPACALELMCRPELLSERSIASGG